MNGTSGFLASYEKLCCARLAGETHCEVQGSKFRKLRTQNSEPRTADRFLHEQRHRLGTGDWHLLHTREHITFFPGSNTKEGKASDIVSNSRMARIIWVLWQAQQ